MDLARLTNLRERLESQAERLLLKAEQADDAAPLVTAAALALLAVRGTQPSDGDILMDEFTQRQAARERDAQSPDA